MTEIGNVIQTSIRDEVETLKKTVTTFDNEIQMYNAKTLDAIHEIQLSLNEMQCRLDNLKNRIEVIASNQRQKETSDKIETVSDLQQMVTTLVSAQLHDTLQNHLKIYSYIRWD